QGLVQDAKAAAPQNGLASKLGGFGGGALAGGALGLLLGNKKFRKMGGKFAAYGGAAALGAVALKTYQDWQQKTAAQAAAGAPAAVAPGPAPRRPAPPAAPPAAPAPPPAPPAPPPPPPPPPAPPPPAGRRGPRSAPAGAPTGGAVPTKPQTPVAWR